MTRGRAWMTGRRPDWSVAPPPKPPLTADSVREALEDTDCLRHTTWRDCAVAGCPPPADWIGTDEVRGSCPPWHGSGDHECHSNLALPMAPWLLARAVRRMWRRLRGRR